MSYLDDMNNQRYVIVNFLRVQDDYDDEKEQPVEDPQLFH